MNLMMLSCAQSVEDATHIKKRLKLDTLILESISLARIAIQFLGVRNALKTKRKIAVIAHSRMIRLRFLCLRLPNMKDAPTLDGVTPNEY